MASTQAPSPFAAATRHRVALRLLPFLFILYIVNYLDRTSVAYAALGMSRDLQFSDRVMGLGIGAFFVSYVALQVPGALLVERWSARRMISATMVVWGLLTALTAAVHTPTQLYLARFALGAAEAGFFPGVIVFLSHWFLPSDRAKATANFMAAIPLSLVIGSPIAGWILEHAWLGIEGWRWLFALEGAPAVLLGAVAFFLLTDRPKDAAWLSPEERGSLESTLQQQKAPPRGPALHVLRSRAVLLLATAAFFDYFMGYTALFWFPTVLKRQSGLSDFGVGLWGAVPYAVAFVAMLIQGWHSDKTGERRWHCVVPLFLGGAALVALLAFPRSTPMVLFSFTVVSCTYVTFLTAFWAIPTEILSDTAAAAAVGMINAIASIAGFAGPYAFGYLNSQTGSPRPGYLLMALSAFVSGVLVLLTPRRAAPTA